MKELKIWIEPKWTTFDVQNNIFTYLLKKKYNLNFDKHNPDFVIGEYHIGKTICFHGEPSYGKGSCTHALVPYYDIPDEKQIRFPLYLYYLYDFIRDGTIDSFHYFFRKRNNENILSTKKNFCNFICGGPLNGNGQFRDEFFEKLNKYKKIDCPGSRYNNMERLIGGSYNQLEASRIKRKFIKDGGYKFTLSFENTSTRDGYNGYTSEKLLDAMVTNTLPIYWGNILINKEFNNRAFINYHDFQSDEEVIDKIIEIDKNDELYIKYMCEPLSYKNDYLNEDFLIDILDKIIKS